MDALRLIFVLLLVYEFREIDSVEVSKNIENDSNSNSNKQLYINVVRSVRAAEHDQEKGDDSQERGSTSRRRDSSEKAETVSAAKSSSRITLTKTLSTVTNPPTTSSCEKVATFFTPTSATISTEYPTTSSSARGVETRTPTGWRTDAKGCIIPSIDSEVCPNGFGYYPHINPEMFCQCASRTLYVMPCAPGTAWDQAVLTCTHACYQQIKDSAPKSSEGTTATSSTKGVETGTAAGWRTDANGCLVPIKDSEVCPNGFGYYQHINPEKFCQCAGRILYVMPCAAGTAWNQALLTCVHANNPHPTAKSTEGTTTISSTKGVETSKSTGWRTDTNGCLIPIIASDVCPNGFGYYPHINPEKFCQCSWWTLYVMPCAPGTAWDQALLTCTHANYQQRTVSSTPVITSTRTSRTTIYQSTTNKNECDSGQTGWRTDTNGCIIPVINLCPNGYGYYEHINPEKFCQCSFQYLYVMPCAPATSWDQAILTCTHGKYQERIGSCSIGDVRTTESGDFMVCVYITNSAGQIVHDWKYCGKNERSSTAKENDGITSSTIRSTSVIATVTNTTPSTTNSTTSSKPSTTTIANPSTTSSGTNTTLSTRDSTTSAKPSTTRSSTKCIHIQQYMTCTTLHDHSNTPSDPKIPIKTCAPTCGSAPNVTGLLVVTPGAANATDKKFYRCQNPDETFPRNVFNPEQCPVITCLSDGTYDKSFNSKAKTCEALPNSPPGDDTRTSPGTITSPGFDGTSPYSSIKADYRWNIVTTGSQLIFNITTFDVRNGNNQCNNGDRLEIFCGFKDSSREFKFCSGSPPRKPVSCSVGCAGVVFVVDDKTTSKGVGFSFSWKN